MTRVDRRNPLIWVFMMIASVVMPDAIAAVERVTVEIAVKDDTGAPVAYATVWSFHDPCTNMKDRLSLCLGKADLEQLAHRLHESFEFVNIGLVPLPMLLVPRAADSKGVFREDLRSDSLASKSSLHGSIRIGYVFLKRGYLPTTVEFEVRDRHSHVATTVVLKRDPKHARSEAMYVDAFERVRFELSDVAANAEMTLTNQERLQRLRNELVQVAQQALESGDMPTAARAYGRLAWMPEVTVIDGRIAGFKQTGVDQQALDRAIGLDPANPLLSGYSQLQRAAEFPNRTRVQSMSADERAAYVAFVDGFASWAEENKGQIWPRFLLQPYVGYMNLGDWERAYRWIRATQAAEPKYEDYEQDSLRDLKSRMQMRGVRVPAHWN